MQLPPVQMSFKNAKNILMKTPSLEEFKDGLVWWGRGWGRGWGGGRRGMLKKHGVFGRKKGL